MLQRSALSSGVIPAHSDHGFDTVGRQITIPLQNIFDRTLCIGGSERNTNQFFVMPRAPQLPRACPRTDFCVLYQSRCPYDYNESSARFSSIGIPL
jgi:hypothetical protein